MNAPPNIDPVAAHSDSDVMRWLTNDTRDERFIDNIFAELCVRLQRARIPVKRASLHVLIYHPQWLGARIMWADGMREAEIARVDYDVRGRSEYICPHIEYPWKAATATLTPVAMAIAQMGTSIAMIEHHYSHLIPRFVLINLRVV